MTFPTDTEIDAIEQEVLAEMPEITAQAERHKVAIQEQTLSGQLRRALLSVKIHQDEGAEAAGVSLQDYSGWMSADAPLPSRHRCCLSATRS